jgi:hypothetical protein
VHGAKWNSIPPLRWVADAMVIMQASEIDWERLLALAEERRLILPLKFTLTYVRDVLGAPVPPAVLHRLQAMPTSEGERFEYEYKIQDYRQKSLGYFPITWMDYVRWASRMHARPSLLGFVKYIQHYWGVELWRFPFQVVALSLRGLRSLMRLYRRRLARMWSHR